MLTVINTHTFADSEYTGVDEVDVGMLGDDVVVLTSTGLSRQEVGVVGANVKGVIQSGELLLAGGNEFSNPNVSLAAEGEGKVRVGREQREYGVLVVRKTYEVDVTAAIDQLEMPLEADEIMKSVQLQIELEGENLKLESFDVYPNPTRHRRG